MTPDFSLSAVRKQIEDLRNFEHNKACRVLLRMIRQWGRAVFTGRIEFDRAIEHVFQAEGCRLMQEKPWRTESSRDKLRTTLNYWVSPKLSVGPGARLGWRLGLTPEEKAAVLKKLAELPPLPAN